MQRKNAAYLIDVVITGFFAYWFTRVTLAQMPGPQTGLVVLVLFIVLKNAYYLLALRSHWQATVGQKIAGCYITNAPEVLAANRQGLRFNAILVSLVVLASLQGWYLLSFLLAAGGVIVHRRMQRRLPTIKPQYAAREGDPLRGVRGVLCVLFVCILAGVVYHLYMAAPRLSTLMPKSAPHRQDDGSLEGYIQAHGPDDPKSQRYQAQLVLMGIHTPQDYAAALQLYGKAAAQGDAPSQFYLGKAYLEGKILPQNGVEAEKWLRNAANQGHREAQAELARLYLRDGVIRPNPEEALRWYTRAAMQGWEDAQLELAQLYESGRSIPADYPKAYFWALLSKSTLAMIDMNTHTSMTIQQKTASHLTQAQRDEVERSAAQWTPVEEVGATLPAPIAAPPSAHAGDRIEVPVSDDTKALFKISWDFSVAGFQCMRDHGVSGPGRPAPSPAIQQECWCRDAAMQQLYAAAKAQRDTILARHPDWQGKALVVDDNGTHSVFDPRLLRPSMCGN